MSRRKQKLERELRHAADYRSWREIALLLDEIEGKTEWRSEDETPDYDFRLIRERLGELRNLREQQRVGELVFALHEGLHGNLGNIANPALYRYCRVGTKLLLEAYLNEVAICLNYLCDNDFEEFPDHQKILFFKRTGTSFGRSALMLSGGATLGMFHVGVVKALVSEGILPRVVSGSSAGSIIAGMLAARTDAEVLDYLQAENMDLEAWQGLDFRTAVKRKALMNPRQLERCLQANMGDYSFEEAFERSRRIVGITVSPIDQHQQGRLLNYLTAPNVLIRRASLASCAVPGVFPPVMLQAKNYAGEVVGYMPTKKWQDGSLRSDLPMLRLARLQNVNHYIVSQTNPHVVPFMMKEQRRRKGMMAFLSELAKTSYGVYSKHVIETARDHMDPEGLGRIIEKVHAVTNQRYAGDITMFPAQPPRKLLKLLSNPSLEDMREFIDEGERATWPHLERIRNSTVISRSFESCLQRLKDRGVSRPAAESGERVVPFPTRRATPERY